ncbi:MAG: hypothetical protein ACKN85_16115, partial [Pirellula sp.]
MQENITDTIGLNPVTTGRTLFDKVSLVVQQVNFNSSITVDSKTLEDLTTTKDGSIKLQSVTGDIIVKEGTAGSY